MKTTINAHDLLAFITLWTHKHYGYLTKGKHDCSVYNRGQGDLQRAIETYIWEKTKEQT